MTVVLALLFFAVPFAELAVIIAVGREIGIAETLFLLVAVSVVGAWLAKHQGLGVWRAVQRRLEAGELPGRELVDGLLVLLAAAFLLTPGFITDAVALLVLLPPVRAGLRIVVQRRFEHRVEVHVAGRGGPGSPGHGAGAWGPVGSRGPLGSRDDAIDAPSWDTDDEDSDPPPPNP